MATHRFVPDQDDAETGAVADTVDQRSLVEVQWKAYTCIRDRSQPIEMSALARELVGRRRRTWAGRTRHDGSVDEQLARIEIRLHHTVLPSLAERGLLEYDPTTREVTPPDGSERY